MNQETQTQEEINKYIMNVCLTLTKQNNQLVDAINRLDQRVTALEINAKVQTVTYIDKK
mgnify:FL=1|jgi:hypothetical protein|tara:strand:+ start:226 stop:402 length:177 start_codon:yes stop_codon:yes gene_type:complete